MSANAMRDVVNDDDGDTADAAADGVASPRPKREPPQVLSYAYRLLPTADFNASTFVPRVELSDESETGLELIERNAANDVVNFPLEQLIFIGHISISAMDPVPLQPSTAVCPAVEQLHAITVCASFCVSPVRVSCGDW
eukprot:SAG11_NODE_1631_length_4544_cov_3.740832_2_plen_139_part_00